MPPLPLRKQLIATWLVLLALLVPLVARAQPTFPQLTGRVVDAANILPADEKARLDTKLAQLEQQTGRQLVVATLPDLQGYDIADYGYQLGRAWGIGEKDKNTGVILLVAPNERKVRIEVGYGLEGTITDGLSALIVQQQIIPRFKEGDMPAGIEAGADALLQQLALPPEEAAKRATAANQQVAAARQQGSGVSLGNVFFVIVIVLFFVLPALRRAFGGRRYYGGSGLGPLIVFDALEHMSRGGRGGGWGGGGDWGGGGGGGFSGGGGSFGGGGASGSW